jgi:6-phosphogluconolactonase
VNQFALISNAADGEISVFHLDGSSGALAPVATYAIGEVVMPLALSKDQTQVFVAARGTQPALIACSMDTATGSLSVDKTTPIDFSIAYLTADPTGRYLLGASYGQNMLGVYALGAEVRLVQTIAGIAHAHCVIVSEDGRFVYVTSLGSDRILGFGLTDVADVTDVTDVTDDATAPLVELGSFALDKGFGPRHIRFSPSGRHLYVVSEFRGTVAVFDRDVKTGALVWRSESGRPDALSHLGDGFARPNFDQPNQPDPKVLASLIWAADLQVHPSGKFVYASERTASVLLTYRVADDGATLTFVGSTVTAQQPRGFKIDPSGNFLVACGEKSTQVLVYRIDPNDGTLVQVSSARGGSGANWIEFVQQTADVIPIKHIKLETRPWSTPL